MITQGSIRNTIIHRVYVDTGSSTNIIYAHCFCLLPDRWKEGLKPTTGQLIGFTGHSLWPLDTIYLPFTLTSHDKTRRKTTIIDFVVIRRPIEHNIILGRATLFRFRAIPSAIHILVKFDTTKGSGTILATPPK